MAVQHVALDPSAVTATRARRCVIAARPKTDIHVIREILAEREIEATASYERPWLGARPLDTVTALVDDADLVIGVLDDPSGSTSVSFELGYAYARDKKILLITDRSFGRVPQELSFTLNILAHPTDADAIADNLDALLSAPAPRRRPYIPEGADTHSIGDIADGLLRRLPTAIQAGDGNELGRIVEDALRASGVAIVTPARKEGPPDSGPDFGVWSDDLESSVGNPFLIEVKTRIPSIPGARRLRQQVKSYVHARNVEWGLVLYGDGPPAIGDDLSEPPLLALRISDLIERLQVEGFASIVSRLHSQAIRNG
jgi:hypothetical protein